MSQKQTLIEKASDVVSDAANQLGLVAMTAATAISLAQVTDKPRVVIPKTMTLTPVVDETNPLRREREETAPHFISYAETQRTPSRSGKQ